MSNNKRLEENYLDYVPVVKGQLEYKIEEDGSVILFQENTGLFNLIAQKLFKKPRISQIHLEEMGNFIWPLINGERSIYEISIEVNEHFGEKAEPLYERLCKYFQMLKEYGFIDFK